MRRPSNDPHARGQATVEFALVLPLVLACILSVAGVTAVCLERLRLSEVARLCARTASVADDPVGTARATALAHRASATVDIDPATSLLTVTVRPSGTIPGLGFVASRTGLAATTTIVLERSPVLR